MSSLVGQPGPQLPVRLTVRSPRSGSARRRGLISALIELLSFGNVLQELVKRDLKVRYKRSVLGIFWTMLNPLLMMVITTIVFSALFRSTITNFPIYVLSGYIVWGFFSQATVAASTSVLDSAGLTRKIYVPAALFPLASVCSAMINLVLSLVPLLVIVLGTGGTITWAWLILPISFLMIATFTYGLGLILAASAVFFRDTVYTFQVLLVAWMYLTPLFYPREIVPAQWAGLIGLNPVYHLIQLVRGPVYEGVLPGADDLLLSLGFAVCVALVGSWYFERSQVRFAVYL
ncbi:MAG: ABC transporter permease [Chloroflexota bacterium]|nr:ABC transporter permease [Chloroflexota bacterium]